VYYLLLIDIPTIPMDDADDDDPTDMNPEVTVAPEYNHVTFVSKFTKIIFLVFLFIK